MYKSFYIRNANEIAIEGKMSNVPTQSIISSTCTPCELNQQKTDKNSEINMINTGVVRNLRLFFSQTSSLSKSPITTSNKLKTKKSYENMYDLKKSQSVLLDQMDESKKINRIEKTRSNNYLNELDMLKSDEEFFSQVNIKARISQFTRRNSLLKETKNCLRKKNFKKSCEIEQNEYKGSLNYLDKIDDVNENNNCNFPISSFDDNSVATNSSDDYISIDYSSSTSKKDLSINLSENENEIFEKKETEAATFDKKKFEQNLSSIFYILDDLKEENELLGNFLTNLQIKIRDIRDTSIEFEKNFDEVLNNNFVCMDDEINKENIDKNQCRMKKIIKYKF